MNPIATPALIAPGTPVRYSPQFLAALRGAATPRQRAITGRVVTVATGTGVLGADICVRWRDGFVSCVRRSDLVPLPPEHTDAPQR